MAAKKGGGRPRTGARPHPRPQGPQPGAGPPGTGRPDAGRPAVVAPNRVMLASAPLLARMSAMPRLVVPVVFALLVLGGLAAGGVGGLVCLLIVASVLGWFLVAFWPVTPGPGRVVRVLAILALVGVGILQAF